MLWTLVAISLAVWLLGVGTSYTLHGFILLFLALAISAAVIQSMSGRQRIREHKDGCWLRIPDRHKSFLSTRGLWPGAHLPLFLFSAQSLGCRC